VLERLENPGAVVTAATRDGSRSAELDVALSRHRPGFRLLARRLWS
jgi:hypothetical protein